MDAPEEQNMTNNVDEAANRALGSETEEDGVDQLLSRSCQMMGLERRARGAVQLMRC